MLPRRLPRTELFASCVLASGLLGSVVSGCSESTAFARQPSAQPSWLAAPVAVDLAANAAAVDSLANPSATLAEQVASAPPKSASEPAATGPTVAEALLTAARRECTVYAKPDVQSTALGYLRAGARVVYDRTPLSGAGCKAGFYAIEPRGYVCGADVSLEPEHVLREAFQAGPDRGSGLPYLYGRARSVPPELYNRVPTDAERLERESSARPILSATWQPLLSSTPEFLLNHQPSLRFNGQRRSDLAVSSGRALPGSAFAFLRLFDTESGAFGLSTDLSVIPLDQVELVTASTFAGVPLSAERGLPLTFVQARNVMLYSGHPRSGLSVARRAQFREAFPMTGRRERVGGVNYLETRSGQWLLDTRALLHIEPLVKMPHWAKQHRTWIDISIDRQTLVAYEGEQPVYATLVSTGQAGAEDPENSRETVQGEFLIHTKHVTRTMSSDVPGDEYDLRDVPYVQYFSGGTALHGAFWHDDFGARKSHGCVNLSPVDARWLFDWSEPKVPQRWHAAMSALEGTLVSVHP